MNDIRKKYRTFWNNFCKIWKILVIVLKSERCTGTRYLKFHLYNNYGPGHIRTFFIARRTQIEHIKGNLMYVQFTCCGQGLEWVGRIVKNKQANISWKLETKTRWMCLVFCWIYSKLPNKIPERIQLTSFRSVFY